MQCCLFHRAQGALAWAKVQSSVSSRCARTLPPLPMWQPSCFRLPGRFHMFGKSKSRLRRLSLGAWRQSFQSVEQTQLAVRDLCQELDTGDSAWGQVFGTSSGGLGLPHTSCPPLCAASTRWAECLLLTALEATSQMLAHGLLSSVAAGLVVSLSFGPGAVLKSLAARRFRCPPMLQGGRH